MATSSKSSLLDRTTLSFVAIALIGGAACAWTGGEEAVWRALISTTNTLLDVVPQVAGGLLLAGLIQVLVSKDAVSRWLGGGKGLRGLLIAEVAGALTPFGPFGSFPLVYALAKVGADIGVLVAYVTAWSTLGLMRLVVWEIPFLGVELALFRFTISLPMAILSGLLARRLARRFPWRGPEA